MKSKLFFYTLTGALAAALISGCGGSGRVSGDSQAIAYDLIFDGEDSNGLPLLFRAALDGSPAELIGSGVPGQAPSPSSDGRTILFQSNWTDDSVPSQLMVLADGSRNPEFFEGGTGGVEREAALSADASRVAFTAMRDDLYGDIFTADVRGSHLENVRNITLPTTNRFLTDATPAWSPNGRQLAFTSYRNKYPTIWIMDADGSHAKQVTPENETYGDYFPSWSPDGKWIAFQRNDSTRARIGIVSAEGGEPRFLPWAGKAYHPAWSPDGDSIAISAVRDNGDLDIFIVSPQGRQKVHIRRQGDDKNPAWIVHRPRGTSKG